MKNPYFPLHLLILFLSIWTFPSRIEANPYQGDILVFKQPDGSLVDVRLFGMEYYYRGEGLDGYTLIRDPKSKWICYAKLSAHHDKLVSSGIPYTGQKNKPLVTPTEVLRFPRHLDISTKARDAQVLKNALAAVAGNKAYLSEPGHPHAYGTPIHPVTGSIVGLTLLVDFSDAPTDLPTSAFESFCNDTNYQGFGNKGSLWAYYKEISEGKVSYKNKVFGFYRPQHSFSYYDSLPFSVGAKQILKEALLWLENQNFDFSSLSINPEDNSIRAINMMYTGQPQDWAKGMWFHKGIFQGFTSASGYRSKDYNTSPANAPLQIGIVCHENGHMVGKWPDTYKYSDTTGWNGIGSFDLMCAVGPDYGNPVPPNPLFLSNAGWRTNKDVTNWNALFLDTANSGMILKYPNPNDSAEFFLFESRRKEGRSLGIPGAGLTVWHIDRNGDNQTLEHEVRLVSAVQPSFESNLYAAPFRSPGRRIFSDSTSPTAKWYNGDPSGLRISEIGLEGLTQSYRIGSSNPASNLKIQILGLQEQIASNGRPDPGEALWLHWKIKNDGNAPSTAANASISALGTSLGNGSLPQPTWILNPLPKDSVMLGKTAILLGSDLEVGEILSLRLLVSQPGYTRRASSEFLIGQILYLQNTRDSSCNAISMDPGQTRNYSNQIDRIQTIFPRQAQQKVLIQFEDFQLEAEVECKFDFLRIYNGPDSNAALLGQWCGNTNPGQILSSHETGALTLYFHSDEGVTGRGWKAKVSCQMGVGILPYGQSQDQRIWPNPCETELFVSGDEPENEVWVTNVWGQQQKLFRKSGNSFSVTHLRPGLYLLHPEKGKASIRFLKN